MTSRGSACDAGAVQSISGGASVLSAVEYYHAENRHYFVTILALGREKLDSGDFRFTPRGSIRPRTSTCRAAAGCEGTVQNGDWEFGALRECPLFETATVNFGSIAGVGGLCFRPTPAVR